jgi:hypothetical protein
MMALHSHSPIGGNISRIEPLSPHHWEPETPVTETPVTETPVTVILYPHPHL